MAWSFEKVGTVAAVNAAVAQMGATNHTGQDSQLSRVKSLIQAEVNAVGSAKVAVKASGHYDSQGSVICITVQPAKTDADGRVFAVPNPN